MPLSPGTRIGSYEITSAIGAGGMGEVYRARDTRLVARKRVAWGRPEVGATLRLCAADRVGPVHHDRQRV